MEQIILMIRGYIKVMLRNLLKRKVFTIINLLGLASGMAVCLLLVLYIENELGYDNFHEHGDQIYRVALERKYPNRSAVRGGIPRSIGQAIKVEYPEVLQSTRVLTYGAEGASIAIDNKTFAEKNILAVDSNFFQVFTGNFLVGDAVTALQKPGAAVINESTAKRYFGSVENALDKNFKIDEFRNCIITGICRDWPDKSHIQFNILVSTSGFQGINDPEYVYFGAYTYLLLAKNTSATALEAKLPQMVDKYAAGPVARLFGESYKQFVSEGNGYRYFLQPITKIHLNSELEDELKPTGSMRIILLLGAIAIFILFLACINYINLSTALSVERAREVGVRKTFGSGKTELMWQFLSESIVFSFVSMLFALLLAFSFIPLLNNISGGELKFTYFLNPFKLLLIFGFSVFVGIVAGVYPAFVLSSFKPIVTLKGRFKTNRYGLALRNGLVIFQFAISVILIICTLVVNQQMQFVLSTKLGFQKDHIISVERMWHLRETLTGDQRQAFVNDISKVPGVENISACDYLPGDDEGGSGATWIAVDNNASRTQKTFSVDDRYSKLLDLEVKQGRFFSKEFTTDSLGVVLNEKAVEDFGLKNPIGAKLSSKEANFSQDDGKKQNVFTVIGVIKDYHFQSMLRKVAPLVLVNSNKFGWGTAGVKINSKHFKTALADIQEIWNRFDAKHPIQFSFLDKNLATIYKSQETEQKIFTIFSLLAILLACTGLFGLATYSAHQRTKEIGIRKLLGAMPGNIIVILSRDFLALVIIASFIAFPVAWWAMYEWLQNFAYRVDISWWIFLLAGAIAAMIAMLTISYQAIKASSANPVKSLKIE